MELDELGKWLHVTLMSQSLLYRHFFWSGNGGMMQVMRIELNEKLNGPHG